ncbi:MAG: Rab family GTPase [Candidatus Odinarchaeia archaeon]
MNYKYIFKIIIVGDEAVGKTCLIKRYTDNIFPTAADQTIGIDFAIKQLTVNESPIKLQLWDFGGQEHYRYFQHTFCDGANGAIISFDLSNPLSFRNIPYWLEFLENNLTEKVPIIIVGNKSDIKDTKVNWNKKMSIYIKKGFNYFETSALENISVEPPFYYLTKRILSDYLRASKAIKVIHY